jgi:hypothetical protein
MRYFTSGAAIVLVLCTASCASDSPTATARHGLSRNILMDGEKGSLLVPPIDPNRRISAQDCRNAFNSDGGNLRCM